MTKRYTSGGVQVHTTDTGAAVNIGAIQSITIPENVETQGDDTGELYELSRSIRSQQPVPMFVTKHIAHVLDIIGIGGQCINCVPPTTPGVRLYGRREGDCKNNPGATANAMHTVVEGLMMLGTLTADRGSDATISVEVHAITDGSNAPVSSVYNVALPDFDAAQWTLAESLVGGIQATEMSGFSIDFGGVITDKTPKWASTWPDTVAMRKVLPRIRIRGFDLDAIAAAGFDPDDGFDCTHANTIFQLIKRANKGKFVDAATAEHITITANGLGTVVTRQDSSGGGDASYEIQIECQHNGTQVPIIPTVGTLYDPDLTD